MEREQLKISMKYFDRVLLLKQFRNNSCLFLISYQAVSLAAAAGDLNDALRDAQSQLAHLQFPAVPDGGLLRPPLPTPSAANE